MDREGKERDKMGSKGVVWEETDRDRMGREGKGREE